MKTTYWPAILIAALLIVEPSRNVIAQTDAEATVDDNVVISEHLAKWPRIVSGDAGAVTLHTPQIDSWDEFLSVQARAAIKVIPAGETEATFGVLEFTGDTDVNLERRLVSVENIEITATGFPSVSDDRASDLDMVVRELVQTKRSLVPLDVLLSYTADEIELQDVDGLSYEPPQIFHSFSPAYLLQTDGPPILSAIEETNLQFVVNTNWDLFRYKEREWYLRDNQRWLKNKGDDLDGEWKYVGRLPREFNKLPEDENWSGVKDAMPPDKTKDDEPVIFVSDRPAELIVIDRAATVRTVGGEGLAYVTTTESDLFRFGVSYYYLVSGRWFKSPQLAGPWEFTAELPDAFLQIPEDHEKGHVLAAIPGTYEARVVAIEAQVPVKATVLRQASNTITVIYDGEPQFELIEGTEVMRVTNSPADVFLIKSVYYLCSSGAWYQAISAEGPWAIADTIPPEIYAIPPSSSSYHVTYVRVYDSNEETVTTGYSSGYLGINVTYGVAVYGTGWYYPPYYRYPYYYPYPYSFGSSAWYNPSTGRYGRTASVYGPYGGYGRGASYNPNTGVYTRGAAAWNSNEAAYSGVGYNPRTGTGVAHNRYVNEDGGWGESMIRNDDKWIQTESQWTGDSRSTSFNTSEGGSGQIDRTVDGDNVYRQGEFEKDGQTLSSQGVRGEDRGAARFESGSGESATFVRSEDGDLYAGKDGEVYRKGEDGWEQYDGDKGWDRADTPEAQAAGLDDRRNTQEQSRDFDRETQGTRAYATAQRPQASAGGGFASTSQSQRSGSAYESNQARSQDLNRNYSARSSGLDRYNTYQRSAGARQRPAGRRRR